MATESKSAKTATTEPAKKPGRKAQRRILIEDGPDGISYVNAANARPVVVPKWVGDSQIDDWLAAGAPAIQPSDWKTT